MRRYFKLGKDRMGWYDSTKAELAKVYGEDVDLFLGMLAATSVNATVKSNLKLAQKAYAQYQLGVPFAGFLPVVRMNLERLVREGKLSGQKISAFWEALKGNPEAVVVDRWMIRAAGRKEYANSATKPTPAQYKRVAEKVRRVAKAEGVEPRQAQAAIWFGVKDAGEKRRGVHHPAPPYQELLREAA